jgi:hypothetical protein
MKLKNIIAVAALACATVASASTNYIEVAKKSWSLVAVVQQMAKDPALADRAAFRKTLEAVDVCMATNGAKRGFQSIPRCCPLTAKRILSECAYLSDKARTDALAHCGYEKGICSLGLKPDEDGYANFILQAAAGGALSAGNVRGAILNAAIVPTRRTIRHEGGTFVGKDGGENVKMILDALANELNSPRFGNAGELLEDIGIEVEWAFIQSCILTDAQIAALKRRLLDGEIAFDPSLQNKLCVALGVVDYNDFVSEYNGK